ncbi:MAG: Orn/Lys/Arg decarboxylase N-terminal domain-containing protein [Bacteroidota bacterium]
MYLYEKLNIAIVDDELCKDTPDGHAMHELIKKMNEIEIIVTEWKSFETALSGIIRLPELDAVIVDWDPVVAENRNLAKQLILNIRSRNHEIPIFLSIRPEVLMTIPLEIERIISENFWILEDTRDFIAGRVEAAARRYRNRLLPPFFEALVNFADDFEYSWHTPGHTGGTAFLKSPAGRIFYNFFGEQLFRSDLSISVGELGSLLDHSGSIGAGERFAAKVFGADRTYYVTNGTSTANKIIFMACAVEGDVVLIDRNCHKSLEHSAILTGSRPVWMVPVRNHLGIIGPIRKEQMNAETIRKKISECPLVRDKAASPVYAVVTNSTYDGICYDAVEVEKMLGEVVSRLHFDEAWYAYARFNPIYNNRYGMRDGARDPDAPTVFVSQSTHKLLAAISQASMVHVKEGRQPIEHNRFNESFMMHTSTSPSYAIIASCDVSAKMMEGPMGKALTDECIMEAVTFRTTMARIRRKIMSENINDWWFEMWQPDEVTNQATGKRISFADAPIELLAKDSSCWVLHPNESWHGFGDIDEGYAMLDPIKVTVLTPGVERDGSLSSWGIPAALLVKYLDCEGIVIEKSGDYSVLFLFSMGITKGKWGTLTTRFFSFKTLYDENAMLEDVFPDLVEKHPAIYGGKSLPMLAHEMHEFKRDSRQLQLLDEAFSFLPEPVMTPAEAYRHLVKNNVERVSLEQAQGRIMAGGIVPYPPGIPLLMGGERTGSLNGPVLAYLKTLQDFDNRFPGFEHETHGIENENGVYLMYCIKV